MNHGSRSFTRHVLNWFAPLLLLASASFGAIPPVEKILPADTLLVFSVPDCTQMSAIVERSPQNRLWNDPAMKAFHDAFLAKWKTEFIEPLERDLGVKLADYTTLLRGQLAVALTQNGWNGQGEAAPGLLLLLDARDRSDLLKTNLATLRKKWADTGKAVRTEKIRDTEFSIVTLSTNDLPPTIKKFFPQRQEIQELGREPEKPDTTPGELVIGQFESLLILGRSVKTVESVMTRLTGGSTPALADEPAFEQDRLKLLREPTAFAWFNAKRFFDVLGKLPSPEPNPQAPSPLVLPDLKRVLDGLGLFGLKSVAFAYRDQPEGGGMELFLGAPETARKGLFNLLTLVAKESGPPPFIPADATKFQRWRLDGKKLVAAFEKLLEDVSPTYLSSYNFLLTTGEAGVRQSNPEYDLRKSVFGNLGDDFLSYEKAPRATDATNASTAPSLFAIGSPDADALCRALAGVLVIRTADALAPQTRDFLGRKIFSVQLPGPTGSTPLHYVAANGYVAFSPDVLLIEEFVRGTESSAKPLREVAGFTEAAERVGGLATGAFCYENQTDAMRAAFDLYRKSPPPAKDTSLAENPFVNALPFAGPEKSLREWMDFTLLPEFEKVAKYFHFSVWAMTSTGEGISFKFFSPTPPAARPAP